MKLSYDLTSPKQVLEVEDSMPTIKSCKHVRVSGISDYCTKCDIYVCTVCKEAHLDHEGKIKSLEEICNQNILTYYEILKKLKSYIKLREQDMICVDFAKIKQDAVSHITKVFDQLKKDIALYEKKKISEIVNMIEETEQKDLEFQKVGFKHAEDLDVKLKGVITKMQDSTHFNEIFQFTHPTKLRRTESKIEVIRKNIAAQTKSKAKISKFKNLKIKYRFKEDLMERMIELKTNFMSERNLLMFQPHSKLLLIADIESKKKKKINLKTELLIPEYFEQAEAQDKVYLLGGCNEQALCLPTTLIYDQNMETLTQGADMNVAKKFHGAVYIEEYIYTVGGSGSYGLLQNCERYEIATDKWVLQSPLNEAREGSALSAFGEQYIYCAGGRNLQRVLNSIECLDIANLKMGWEAFKVRESWMGSYFSGAFQVSEQELLIFGGTLGEGRVKKECYLFNVENRDMRVIATLKRADCFFSRHKKIYKDMAYAIGYSHFDIHILSLENMKWSIIQSGPYRSAGNNPKGSGDGALGEPGL